MKTRTRYRMALGSKALAGGYALAALDAGSLRTAELLLSGSVAFLLVALGWCWLADREDEAFDRDPAASEGATISGRKPRLSPPSSPACGT